MDERLGFGEHRKRPLLETSTVAARSQTPVGKARTAIRPGGCLATQASEADASLVLMRKFGGRELRSSGEVQTSTVVLTRSGG